MTFSVALAAGGVPEKRRALDHYPTPPDCTWALVHFLGLQGLFLWEPACGKGDMATVLEEAGNAVYASDIADYGYGHAGVDYLATPSPERIEGIITNPPFDESENFIKKAVREAPLVAMLFKSQFWHSQSRYLLFEENPPSWVLPLCWRPNFIPERGSSPTMEVCWTVWQRGDTATKYKPLLRPIKNALFQ